MTVLIVYATTEGHTAKIADQIGDWARERGFKAYALDSTLTDENTNVSGFDAYIVAGSVHFEKHSEQLVTFVRRQWAALQKGPSAFLSVSGSASRNDEESQADARGYIQDFIRQTGWNPTKSLPVAGAMLYSKYNFFLRLVMRRINKQKGGPTDTSRDYDLTDWVALRKFVDDFLTEYVEDKHSDIAEQTSVSA